MTSKNMNRTIRMITAMGIFLVLAGCSYYGTNTFLVPADKDRNIECSNMKLEVGGILTAQEKKAHAFAGIPYFPEIINSTPIELGELPIWYQNIPDDNICTTDDLILKSNISQIAILPIGIWKSKLVEKNGMKYLGCNYKFGQQLDVTQEYSISFKNGLFNCNLPEVRLTIKNDSGYHQVLIQ